MLCYGVLSSHKNVDEEGLKQYEKILTKLDVDTLHANQLSIDKLTLILPELLKIHDEFRFGFDFYFIDKLDYALVLFFDSVFDAGLNEAVSWHNYWTPLRFLHIYNLAALFDIDLLKKSWGLCVNSEIEKSETEIVELLEELKKRASSVVTDQRWKEVFINAFDYGIKYPLRLDFGRADAKTISPNSVGFQFVVSSMAKRLNQAKIEDASSIIVDMQHQFNSAQITTHFYAKRIAEGLKNASDPEKEMLINHPLYSNFSIEEVLRVGTPKKELTVLNSRESIGLQITDIYLWVISRVYQGKELNPKLLNFANHIFKQAGIDGISVDAMMNRFQEFASQLPKEEDLAPDQVKFGNTMLRKHRDKIKNLYK